MWLILSLWGRDCWQCFEVYSGLLYCFHTWFEPCTPWWTRDLYHHWVWTFFQKLLLAAYPLLPTLPACINLPIVSKEVLSQILTYYNYPGFHFKTLSLIMINQNQSFMQKHLWKKKFYTISHYCNWFFVIYVFQRYQKGADQSSLYSDSKATREIFTSRFLSWDRHMVRK